MVNKSKIIILSIFIFSLAFFLYFTVFPKNSLACHLGGPYDFYKGCSSRYYCSHDSDCGTDRVSAYNFEIDWGGCEMGYVAGLYYTAHCGIDFICICDGPKERWYKSPSYNGQLCRRVCGGLCNDVEDGNWDSSDSKCVVCYGAVETGYFNSYGDYYGDYKCESACGADPTCDEKPRGTSLPDSCGRIQLEVSRYCDESCKYSSVTYTCGSSRACDVRSCGGQTYYCVYDSTWGWRWSTSIPTGFCCKDSDCPAYDPSTHLKMYCDTNTHTCKTIGSCQRNDQCEGGWCCDYLVGGWGSCKQKGTITSYGGRSYLCDPPEGFVNSSNEEINVNNQANKKLTLLDLLINPFSYFFKR
jgi:hypothetical protein